MTEKLLDAGFDVAVAYNGEQGYDKIIQEKPDIVLMDIVIPELDGVEVLRKIRTNEATKYIQVIILSNVTDEDKLKQIEEMGITDFWTKGQHSFEELVEMVKKYIGK